MKVTDIQDLHLLAKRRLPAMIYAYISNGGYEQETLAWNRRDLDRFALVPRVIFDVSTRSMKTTLAGDEAIMPVALAPVGACGLAHVDGEIGSAVAAKKESVPFTLSTLSIDTLEEVAKATQSPFWFQLYLLKDRSVTKGLIKRALDCGVSNLLLSLDVHVRSQRHPEQRHGLMAPPRVNLANIWDALSHPRWLFPMIGSKHKTFGNLLGLYEHAKSVAKTTEWLETQFDPTIDLETIEWLRDLWPRKLFVKGLLHPQDARLCIEHGCDGVVVSNHGGRQADGVVSTCSILPWVVKEVAGRGQVLVDSGIRSGIDVLKMLALGADGCLIGRAYMYGLAAMGQEGVEMALGIIRKELDQTMGLCGITDIHRLPPDLITEHENLMLDIRTPVNWREGNTRDVMKAQIGDPPPRFPAVGEPYKKGARLG